MPTSRARLLILIWCLVAGLLAQLGDGEIQLLTARTLLTGEHKDTESARKLLLEIVQSGRLEARPGSLSYAYVYLGYIEDRSGDRQRAISWFQKALGVKGGERGILQVAESGLKQPITWIRHLDENESPLAPARGPAEARRAGQGFVVARAPTGMTPARGLSAQQRRENFDALWSAIDSSYAHFGLKSIDWNEVGRRYRGRLDTTRTDDDFYELIFQLVNELKDAHSWLQNYKLSLLEDVTELSVDLFQGRPYVIAVKSGSEPEAAGVRAGWEVESVDGLTVAEKMEALRPYLRA